uniref:G domain-containing protein n=1 Tax=Salarias fasciatus TaxID=181472 RepID=A0A672G509_SALFA
NLKLKKYLSILKCVTKFLFISYSIIFSNRNKKEDFDYVSKFKPCSEAQHLRVLLHGPAGSGKSSFINSVDSALRGRIGTRALAATNHDDSFSKEYKGFRIQTEKPGTYYPLVFCDTMGIEKGSGRGVDVENIKLIMKGHVKDGCKLLPGSTPTGSDYIESPTINDKVQCSGLCCSCHHIEPDG